MQSVQNSSVGKIVQEVHYNGSKYSSTDFPALCQFPNYRWTNEDESHVKNDSSIATSRSSDTQSSNKILITCFSILYLVWVKSAHEVI